MPVLAMGFRGRLAPANVLGVRDWLQVCRVAAVPPNASTLPNVVQLQTVGNLAVRQDVGDYVCRSMSPANLNVRIALLVTIHLPRPTRIRTAGLINP